MPDVDLPRGVQLLLNTGSIVALESPLAGADEWAIEANIAYARACARWCLLNGLVPLASHLHYGKVLDDSDPDQRRMGMEAGFVLNRHAVASLVFTDRGVSQGMRDGIANAVTNSRPVYRLQLPGWSA